MDAASRFGFRVAGQRADGGRGVELDAHRVAERRRVPAQVDLLELRAVAREAARRAAERIPEHAHQQADEDLAGEFGEGFGACWTGQLSLFCETLRCAS